MATSTGKQGRHLSSQERHQSTTKRTQDNQIMLLRSRVPLYALRQKSSLRRPGEN